MAISNLTQHVAAPEQMINGVAPCKNPELLKELLTFKELPRQDQIIDRAAKIAALCNSNFAMIGGAPFLMGPLHAALNAKGIKVLYAFSERVSNEVDGVKTSVFKHVGFTGDIDLQSPTSLDVGVQLRVALDTSKCVGSFGAEDKPLVDLFIGDDLFMTLDAKSAFVDLPKWLQNVAVRANGTRLEWAIEDLFRSFYTKKEEVSFCEDGNLYEDEE